jgi:histidyl-tRNA synthetase
MQTPRGTKDIDGSQVQLWRLLEDAAAEICRRYCLDEMRTPIFEHTELFQRGVGDGTDIVQKEMYTFLDKGGRSITLRPELTAGAARAFVEHKLYAEALPAKFYYLGPAFRYERPAAGRLRQFHQFGVEYFGITEPAADAEVISLAELLFEKLGIRDYQLKINSIGGPECRLRYNAELKTFIKTRLTDFCATCQTRYEINPMRVLDCKNDKCQALLQQAPIPLDFLGPECMSHFERLQRLLDALGINFVIDGRIVRGLDYYTRTVFEFVDNSSGLAIGGGGRYDGLIEECGGPSMGAVGFAVGVERLLSLLQAPDLVRPDIYINAMGEPGFMRAQALAYELRGAGVRVVADLYGGGLKAQMRRADRSNARFSIVIGDNELANNQVEVKNMGNGAKTLLSFDRLAEFLQGSE